MVAASRSAKYAFALAAEPEDWLEQVAMMAREKQESLASKDVLEVGHWEQWVPLMFITTVTVSNSLPITVR